jgi:hypothetical protein
MALSCRDASSFPGPDRGFPTSHIGRLAMRCCTRRALQSMEGDAGPDQADHANRYCPDLRSPGIRTGLVLTKRKYLQRRLWACDHLHPSPLTYSLWVMGSCRAPLVKPACNFFLQQPPRPKRRPAGGRQSDVDAATGPACGIKESSIIPRPLSSVLCSGPPPLAQLESSPTARGTAAVMKSKSHRFIHPLRPRLAVQMPS